MKRLTRIAVGAGAVLGFSALSHLSPPAPTGRSGPASALARNHAVFVQTDNPPGTRSSPTTAPTTAR